MFVASKNSEAKRKFTVFQNVGIQPIIRGWTKGKEEISAPIQQKCPLCRVRIHLSAKIFVEAYQCFGRQCFQKCYQIKPVSEIKKEIFYASAGLKFMFVLCGTGAEFRQGNMGTTAGPWSPFFVIFKAIFDQKS